MKKKKVYSKDFKLHVVKGYQNRRKSLKDFSNKYYIYQLTLFNNGFKGKKRSNYDDSIFDTKKGRTTSIISDYSKMPPIICESDGIDRSNNYRDSDDTFYLKRKLECYEKILLEKEIQLKIAQDGIEL